MNRAMRFVGLSIVASGLIAGAATAAAAGTWADPNVAFGDVDEPQFRMRPTVSSFSAVIEQAAAQDDPTASTPVAFEVTFGRPIDPASFTDADLVQIGSAPIGVWNIVNSGNNRDFEVTAQVLGAGTVIPTIPADSVEDFEGNSNHNSVSADNSVTYGAVGCTTFTYLYVAIWSPPSIRVFCIEADGSLTYQGPPVPAPGDVRDMEVSAEGKSLYYAHAHLTRFIISSDGSIVEAGSNEVGNGAYDDLLLDPAGRYLYATHSTDGGTVFVYDTAPVTTVPPQRQAVSGFYIPHGLAIHPSGQYIYIANYYDIWNPEKIVSFPLFGDGRLDLNNSFVTPYTARAMYFAINPSGTRLYWSETVGGGAITGSLAGPQVSLFDSDFSGFGARSIDIDADGSHVYVANYNDDDIAVFEVSGNGGLIGQALRPTERRPEHLLLHPNGDYLYVANAGDVGGPSHVSIYRVEANGDLIQYSPRVIPDQGAYRLAIVTIGAP